MAASSPYTGEPLGVSTDEMKFGIKGVAADGDAEPSAACGGRDCDSPRRPRNPGRRERAWDCGWPKRWANRQKIYVDFTKYGISP